MDFVSVGMNAVSVADEFGMLVKRANSNKRRRKKARRKEWK